MASNHPDNTAKTIQRTTVTLIEKLESDLAASQAKVAELEKELAERDLLEARNSGEIAKLIEIAKHY